MTILDIQKQLLNDIINNSPDATDILYAKQKLKKLEESKPLMAKRYASTGHESIMFDHNLTNREIYMDITTINAGLINAAQIITTDFNSNSAELKSITEELKKISAVITDLALISSDNDYHAIYFKDSFINKDNIEQSTGRQCDILTNEGIAVLSISGANEFNLSIADIKGNGNAGNYHILNKEEYLSNYGANDDIKAMTDKEPNTIYEYQALNPAIPSSLQIYDTQWINNAGSLRIKITAKLDAAETINWISLNPYYPEKSKRMMQVQSIRVSEDGINYSDIGQSTVLNEEINLTPQTYVADNTFSKSLNSKGIGVWNFPARKAQFIEFVIDQSEAYKELVGHTYYNKINQDETSSVLIPEKDVPESIVNAPLGKYVIDEGYIEKALLKLNAERLCIGIRDIATYGYTFSNQCELMSKQYVSDKPISSISLLVNEFIPEEFLNDLSKRNDWIKYYVSIDDINWIRISPMSHMPLGSGTFPPKLITINGTDQDKINVLNITSDKDVNTIRFKAVMTRPSEEEYKMYTPVLYDYAVRCTTL